MVSQIRRFVFVVGCLLPSGCAGLATALALDNAATPAGQRVTAQDSGFSTAAATGTDAPAKQSEFQAGQPIYAWVKLSGSIAEIPRRQVYVVVYWTANPEYDDGAKLLQYVQAKGDKLSSSDMQPGGMWRTNFKLPETQAADKILTFPLVAEKTDPAAADRLALLNDLSASATAGKKYTVVVKTFWDGGNEKPYETFSHFALDTSKGSYDKMALNASADVAIPQPKMEDAAVEKETVRSANLQWGSAEKKTYFKTVIESQDWSLVRQNDEVVGRVLDGWVMARGTNKKDKACYLEKIRIKQQKMNAAEFGKSIIDKRDTVHRLDCARFKGLK